MIELDTLKELVRLMVENDLSEIDLQDEQESVTLRRGASGHIVHQQGHAPGLQPMAPANAQSAAPTPAPTNTVSATTADPDEGLVAIESPMVGTFYSAPSPDDPPYISPGKSVGPETVVCIIEAMKVFNEIKAETSGVVERILVKNGEPVEFGQKLFLVRPS